MKKKKGLEEEISRLERIIMNLRSEREFKIPSRSNTLVVGIVSDTHIGSLYERTDALHEFYKELKREKVKIVLNAGDILDGIGIYRGQEFEQYAYGFERQLDSLIKNYPRGIKTYFITGNHDSSFKKKIGINVGKEISKYRDDLIFLGEDYADIDFKVRDGHLKYKLIHPSGGSAYAVSYKLQKIAESLSGGRKPHVLICGHFHKSAFITWRNIYCFHAGTFQSQTPYMQRKYLPAHIGGWIIEHAPSKLSSRM